MGLVRKFLALNQAIIITGVGSHLSKKLYPSSEKSLTKNLRVFAKIKAGLILVDHGNISEIDILLRQVIENGGPFSFHAKEIFALALIKDGRDLEAQEIFQEIVNDASAPPVLARRAEIFLR